MVTSTGFGAVDFAHWPDFLPIPLIYISFIGGCGGSTVGGIKVLRVRLMIKQGWQEFLPAPPTRCYCHVSASAASTQELHESCIQSSPCSPC